MPWGFLMPSKEVHFVNRAGWLRAAVLGANDGIISTASLIVGVAAAAALRGEILTAAAAGWAAGAMAMAAGEMCRSARRPIPKLPTEREQRALEDYPADETLELAEIYERRGLTPSPLARQVAEQLMAKDALSAHARDELGFGDGAGANPILAAFASAISFSLGAAMPTLAAFVAPRELTVAVVSAAALSFSRSSARLAPGWEGLTSSNPRCELGFGALWRWL